MLYLNLLALFTWAIGYPLAIIWGFGFYDPWAFSAFDLLMMLVFAVVWWVPTHELMIEIREWTR